MPHSDPAVAISALAEVIRATDTLSEWAENPHAFNDVSLFPGAAFTATDMALRSTVSSQLAPYVAHGTPGPDSLSTSGNVVALQGGAGNDVLSGHGNSVWLYGGSGDDVLAADNQGVLYGGSGDDTLTSGAGIDILYGGPGNDRLAGGAGNDFLVMSPGDDVVMGGPSSDTLVLGEGWNQPLILALTSAGPDDGGGVPATVPGQIVVTAVENVVGGSGDDTIAGGNATNILFGMSGNDHLDGGGGADVLDGGAGADVLTGGAGADIFRFQTSDRDVVTDYSQAEGDRLQLPGQSGQYTLTPAGGDLLITDAEGDLIVRLTGITNAAQVTIDYLAG